MAVVPARVAGEIEVRVEDLPKMALEQIKAALTFPNEDREKRAAEKIFGWWDLPEVIWLYRIEARRGGETVLCLPRGFASQLVAGLAGLGHEVQWEDRRVRVPAQPGYFTPFVLRDYQLAAVIDILKHQQGFYECPAGGGKTVTALGAMAWAQQRTLVIVDKAGLLEQWRERAATFFGLSLSLAEPILSVGKIGEDIWEERELTIALRQTLWSREWELKATGWWKLWGMTWFDEGHHLGAETLGELCRRVVSAYMDATSATPSKSYTHGRVVHALVGPVIHRTTRQELYERGVLMQPTVERIDTGFEAPFWVTHDAVEDKGGVFKCQVPDCKKRGKHGHRNNYQTVLKKLVESRDRNERIAQRIVSDRGHIHLVPSRQLKHLDLLRKACEKAGWDGPIYMLRGEENAAGLSQQIARAIIEGGFWEISEEKEGRKTVQVLKRVADWDVREAIIFSTVADEGLDIPPIDRVHVVFPMKQDAATIQLVGRGERVADGKTETLIVDYIEPGEPFDAQASERDRVYRMQGFQLGRPQAVVG